MSGVFALVSFSLIYERKKNKGRMEGGGRDVVLQTPLTTYIATCCQHFARCLRGFSTLKMETVRSSETSANFIRGHISQDSILDSHRCEDLKYYNADNNFKNNTISRDQMIVAVRSPYLLATHAVGIAVMPQMVRTE
jgi:hypothetical protein